MYPVIQKNFHEYFKQTENYLLAYQRLLRVFFFQNLIYKL